MRGPRRAARRASAWLALAGALTMLATAQARASQFRVSELQAISASSPFPHGCPGAIGDEARIAGAEIEPMVTVNPADPRNIVATWQQDLGVAARSDLIGVSRDGGRSWRRVAIPRLTSCTGGTADAASDPWVSAGGDGRVYFAGAAASLASDPPAVAFVASVSRDGGRTWPLPVSVAGADPRNDKETITAHPRRPGHAYMMWANRDIPPRFPSRSVLRFSRTATGGASWSRPVVVDRAPADAADVSGQVLVLRHGALLAVFSRVTIRPDGSVRGSILARRSTDEGRTWGGLVRITSTPIRPLADPEGGEELPNQDVVIFGAAVGPGGSAYVAWDQDRSPRSGSIRVARSRRGGLAWSRPRALPGVHAFAFQPAIAVDASHTVGVLWYDTRRDRRGDAGLTTDVWFAHSHDGGGTWRMRHVAGPFDFRTAPRPSGSPRLGEYQGLAPLPRGFAAVFTMSAPLAEDGPSDIFFARLEPR